MSEKPELEVRNFFEGLRTNCIGSPGMVDLIKTCQMLGVGQEGLLGLIGTAMVETPKMKFGGHGKVARKSKN
jgi:hypothetical protein